MKKLSLAVLMFFSAVLTGVAQNKPVQFDEYGRISCEDLMARAEALGLRLKTNPSESAVIVGYNLREDKLNWQPILTHRRLIGLFGNALNARFYTANDKGTPRTEVWIVPHETSFKTAGFEQTLSIPFRPTAKTRVGGSYEQDTCSSQSYRAFLEVIATTKLDGQIVLINQPRREREKSIASYRRALKAAGLDINRVSFRYKTVKNDPHDISVYDEFWLIP